MRSSSLSSIAAAALSGALFASSVAAVDLPPIIIKGSHFFYENGTEFFIKGIAYQQDFSTNGTGTAAGTEPTDFTDPLADEAGCRRDVPLLEELGANTVRVYAIDAEKNHDTCMKLLNDAGIYVIQDLSNPGKSVNRNSPEWTTELFSVYAGVVDAMAGYSNTLGFFAGNEVSNVKNNTNASAFVKAAVRDMKQYIKTKDYRTIGVGYATNDDPEIRLDLKDYFNCGDKAEAIDFWGYNIYSWCGDSSFQESGFDQRTLEFANYSIPAFFAEYGCNTVQPRRFTEVGAIYGEQMTDVWSGGIMYMYFQEANDYGIVKVDNGRASKLPDFTALQRQLARATPAFTSADAYNPTNTAAQDCPATGAAWMASEKLPPVANANLCECMVSSLECVANDDLTGEDIDTIFGSVCGLDSKACDGIAANATTGVYGSYSMCTGQEKLSFAMNQYYLNQDKASDACSFDGQASTKSASSSGDCDSLIEQAGSSGTGTVTGAPSTPSGTGSASSSSGTGNAAFGSFVIPRLDVGLLHVGLYVVIAGFTGAGMIML